MANSTGRSPSAWSAAGALAYISGLSVSAIMLGPLFSAMFKREILALGLVLYVATMNATALALTNILCRCRFNKNLTTMSSLARLSNIAGIVIAIFFLTPSLIGLYVMGYLEHEEMAHALLMAGLCLVFAATLFVFRNGGKGVMSRPWATCMILSANAILVMALPWYTSTWAISHLGTMSTISAYMFGWLTFAATLNVLGIGLEAAPSL